MAQSSRLVGKEPKFCQGFLILNDDLPNLSGFKVFIYDRQFQSNGTWNDVLVDQVKLIGKNYFRIPTSYFVENGSHEYVYIVHPLDLSDNMLVSHEPVPLIGDGTPWLVKELTICNGPTFAFGIQQYMHPNGGLYNYSLTSVGDYFDEALEFGGSVPFYEYVYLNQWNSLGGIMSWRQYHGLENSDSPQPIIPSADHNRVIQVPEGGTYYNSSEELLSSDLNGIIGVQKTLGPWRVIGSSACYANGIVTDWTQFGANGLIAHFNDYSNMGDWVGNADPDLYVADELFCPSNAYIGSYDQEETDMDNSCFDQLSLDDENPENDMDMDGDVDVDLYDNQLFYADCMEYSIPYMEEVFVASYDGLDPVEEIHFTHSDLHDSAGNLIFPDFSLSEGLYSVTTLFGDGKYMAYYVDVQEPLSNTCAQSALLDVTVFPVPIIGDEYHLHLVSQSSLNFRYEVVDLNARIHYSEQFRISGPIDKNHKIECEDLPNGIILHRFIFEDGSAKVIHTTR